MISAIPLGIPPDGDTQKRIHMDTPTTVQQHHIFSGFEMAYTLQWHGEIHSNKIPKFDTYESQALITRPETSGRLLVWIAHLKASGRPGPQTTSNFKLGGSFCGWCDANIMRWSSLLFRWGISNNPRQQKTTCFGRLPEHNQGAHPDLRNLQEDEKHIRQSSPLKVTIRNYVYPATIPRTIVWTTWSVKWLPFFRNCRHLVAAYDLVSGSTSGSGKQSILKTCWSTSPCQLVIGHKQ